MCGEHDCGFEIKLVCLEVDLYTYKLHECVCGCGRHLSSFKSKQPDHEGGRQRERGREREREGERERLVQARPHRKVPEPCFFYIYNVF